MKAIGRYDTALQMFVEEPREPDMGRLAFLKHLIWERGALADDLSPGHDLPTIKGDKDGVAVLHWEGLP